jgi:hypothetical protein
MNYAMRTDHLSFKLHNRELLSNPLVPIYCPRVWRRAETQETRRYTRESP